MQYNVNCILNKGLLTLNNNCSNISAGLIRVAQFKQFQTSLISSTTLCFQ